jgi:hypothetical protein
MRRTGFGSVDFCVNCDVKTASMLGGLVLVMWTL